MKSCVYTLIFTILMGLMPTSGMAFHMAKNLFRLPPTLVQQAQKVVKGVTGTFKKVALAETIYYRPDGKPISDKDHEKIYDIKLHKQFPMSLEYDNPPVDEMAAIQQELDNRVPGVKVQFIPTTVYELFALACLEETYDSPCAQAHRSQKFYGEAPSFFSRKGFNQFLRPKFSGEFLHYCFLRYPNCLMNRSICTLR